MVVKRGVAVIFALAFCVYAWRSCSAEWSLFREHGCAMSYDDLISVYRNNEDLFEQLVGVVDGAKVGDNPELQVKVDKLVERVGGLEWWGRRGVVFLCMNRYGYVREMRYQGFAVGDFSNVSAVLAERAENGELRLVARRLWVVK